MFILYEFGFAAVALSMEAAVLGMARTLFIACTCISLGGEVARLHRPVRSHTIAVTQNKA